MQMVFLGRSVHVVRQWHLFYHIFAWGAPLLGVIIVLAGTVRLTTSHHHHHHQHTSSTRFGLSHI
jgi:hypothetical protein